MNGPVLIHDAVAQWAEHTPDAPALITPEQRISHARLDRAAALCAAALGEYGVGPGDLLPVILPRSAELVPVLLGILRRGAGYAALDPRWPAGRIRDLLEALNPPLCVTRGIVPGGPAPGWAPPEGLFAPPPRKPPAPRPPGPGAARTVPDAPAVPVVPTAPAVPAAPAVPGLRPAAGPDSPAIVFFTTGTTGTPRGVISPHRATTRLVRDATAWTGPGRIMAQTAPASGDTYSLEVWVTLAAGGACAIPGDGGHPTPARLRSLVRGCSVDTVFLTTSLLNRLMDEDPGCLSGLRTVLTGGERMSVHHVRLCRLTHPGLEIVNCYGPAGNGVLATVRTVRPQDLAAAGGVPLGTAVSATGLHILNGQDPAPPGGTGEICLSGGGLALGYLGDPWLTAERFPTVSLGGPATRIHRTGDRGALGADGVLRFQGRDRRQVTIGGRRIDPQETEDAARRLPGVTECVVLPVYGERETDTRLALFYTASAALTADTAAADTCAAADADAADLTAADTGTGTGGGPDLSPAGVRRALAAVLPAPLVPRLISRRPSFPLDPHGKTDRSALLALLLAPDPGPPRPDAPRTRNPS